MIGDAIYAGYGNASFEHVLVSAAAGAAGAGGHASCGSGVEGVAPYARCLAPPQLAHAVGQLPQHCSGMQVRMCVRVRSSER